MKLYGLIVNLLAYLATIKRAVIELNPYTFIVFLHSQTIVINTQFQVDDPMIQHIKVSVTRRTHMCACDGLFY